MVKRGRIRLGEFFVCFDWVGCPQLAVAHNIYRVGGLAPQGIV
jgi:hypothetical protein